jgi:hypothetical protein
MTKPGATVRRVTANLRERDEANLEHVAKSSGLSPNDAIRQSLATQAWVQDTIKSGSRILVQGDDGVVREVKFVG